APSSLDTGNGQSQSDPVPKTGAASYHADMTGPSLPWLRPQVHPGMTLGEVHIWRLSLKLADEQIARLRVCLTPDEEARAARYHFDRHPRLFIACGGRVREILAGYLPAGAADLRFRYSTRGKP